MKEKPIDWDTKVAEHKMQLSIEESQQLILQNAAIAGNPKFVIAGQIFVAEYGMNNARTLKEKAEAAILAADKFLEGYSDRL